MRSCIDFFSCLLFFGILLYCSSYCVTTNVHFHCKWRERETTLLCSHMCTCIHIQNASVYTYTIYTYMHTQGKNLLNNAKTLVADGIHQVHFIMGGNSSGFAGNRRKEINCSNLSTTCLNLCCEILKEISYSDSHVIAVQTEAYIIRFQYYLLKNMLSHSKNQVPKIKFEEPCF